MSSHEFEKQAFFDRLKQKEENAMKIRDGMAQALDPEKTEPTADRFPEPHSQPEPQEPVEVQPEDKPEIIEPDPQPQPAQAEAPEDKPSNDKESDPDYWKHRFLTTEGILRSLKDSAKEREQEMRQQMEQLRAEMDKVKRESLDSQKKFEQNSRDRAVDDIALTDFFTAEQIEEYGKDHLKTVLSASLKASARLNRSELDREVEQLRDELNSIRNTAAQSQEQAFWTHVNSALPDWQTTQNDPAFHDWLNEVDPVSGQKRDAYVKDAQSKLDAPRVVAIFKAFRDGKQVEQPVKVERQRPSAPPVGKSTAAELPTAPKKLRLSDWKKFQLEVTQGQWRGREAEAAAVDRKFIEAMQQGNIV